MTLCKMQELEADIPKMAVMPQRERDVLVLLDATLSMKELHAQTPVITMAMGRNGVVSRLSGEVFGCDIWDGRSTVRTGTDRCGRIKEDFGTFGRRLMSTKKQNTRSQF